MITAFHACAREIARQLRETQVDHAAFETRLRPCDLSTCRATCCHDGVMLNSEEVEVIGSVVKNLDEYGFDESIHWLENNEGRQKTATRPAVAAELAPDFPDHFSKTRCVFLDSDHQCVLQRYSADVARHDWHYKPIGCWMHPVALLPAGAERARPLLTLRTRENSSGAMTDFATCTHCGRRDDDGVPAYEVLRDELSALAEISGRDFLAELTAPSVDEC